MMSDGWIKRSIYKEQCFGRPDKSLQVASRALYGAIIIHNDHFIKKLKKVQKKERLFHHYSISILLTS